eukprot:TRINITY_DN46859_c0_g1_i1.p2 TRINITY_DN46859_c0_g1~~TRINITY_DN46859_c0_g1_i1.p2  ORF type:complete len:115 (+),score=10.68 TRINITY_DN46859_c0_g1_i1:50-394(+)
MNVVKMGRVEIARIEQCPVHACMVPDSNANGRSIVGSTSAGAPSGNMDAVRPHSLPDTNTLVSQDCFPDSTCIKEDAVSARRHLYQIESFPSAYRNKAQGQSFLLSQALQQCRG